MVLRKGDRGKVTDQGGQRSLVLPGFPWRTTCLVKLKAFVTADLKFHEDGSVLLSSTSFRAGKA